jgi:hypothetical protein
VKCVHVLMRLSSLAILSTLCIFCHHPLIPFTKSCSERARARLIFSRMRNPVLFSLYSILCKSSLLLWNVVNHSCGYTSRLHCRVRSGVINQSATWCLLCDLYVLSLWDLHLDLNYWHMLVPWLTSSGFLQSYTFLNSFSIMMHACMHARDCERWRRCVLFPACAFISHSLTLIVLILEVVTYWHNY